MNNEFKRERLFEKVAERLRRRAREEMKPGQKLPDIHTLARELRVSEWTLRSAQALLAREGVLEVRHGSGVYVPRLSHPVVGIYTNLDILQPRTSAFHIHTPRELRLWLARQGVRAEIYLGESEVMENRPVRLDSRFAGDVAAGRLAGLALFNTPSTSDWSAWLRGLVIPAVGPGTPWEVLPDMEGLVRAGVKRLAEQGCRRIALLAWQKDGLERIFREAMAEAGLPVNPAWCRYDLHPMLSGAGWETFREVWAAGLDKPDGLIVADDVLFNEAQTAILELGIPVPSRLRIVAHANKGDGRRYPFPVTRMQLDPARFAALLGGMLLARLRGETLPPSAALLPFERVEAGELHQVAQGGSIPLKRPKRNGIVLEGGQS